ncbi:hypothetical protein HK096_000013 [Nowakowskiella sp. JEL0078]|nr:hypothetical protein HK096_000013 [Nowakowskiella sp. JEL0078]
MLLKQNSSKYSDSQSFTNIKDSFAISPADSRRLGLFYIDLFTKSHLFSTIAIERDDNDEMILQTKDDTIRLPYVCQTQSLEFKLKVYGANCYGIDKISFDSRVLWIDENIDLIINLNREFILKADEPIKFDATCSGLQHIAAILKDDDLASSVNIKGSQRRDLYSDALEKINHA